MDRAGAVRHERTHNRAHGGQAKPCAPIDRMDVPDISFPASVFEKESGVGGKRLTYRPTRTWPTQGSPVTDPLHDFRYRIEHAKRLVRELVREIVAFFQTG